MSKTEDATRLRRIVQALSSRSCASQGCWCPALRARVVRPRLETHGAPRTPWRRRTPRPVRLLWWAYAAAVAPGCRRPSRTCPCRRIDCWWRQATCKSSNLREQSMAERYGGPASQPHAVCVSSTAGSGREGDSNHRRVDGFKAVVEVAEGTLQAAAYLAVPPAAASPRPAGASAAVAPLRAAQAKHRARFVQKGDGVAVKEHAASV